MRILFLSFYYPPDLSAGSFRASALIEALLSHIPAHSQIDVLTTMPNRYSSFNASAPEVEAVGSLLVHRIPLPSHKSGMVDQSKAFLTYARDVRAHTHKQKYDLVFATSSRLMTAVLGASIARRQKVPLYLDIRDIFVDTIQDVLPRWQAWPMGIPFSMLERYAINVATRVNLVSRGFEDYFKQRYPHKALSFFSNGIDEEFLEFTYTAGSAGKTSKPPYSVLYAGNLGEGQGLHIDLPPLALALQGRAHFTIIGDGGRKAQLINALERAGINNVTLQDPVNRQDLIKAYQQADVLFLHLNDYNAFRKVLPSKIFEYAATGKPIWAGVNGYAAEFMKAEIENAQVFAPCTIDQAVEAFAKLRFEHSSRVDFISKFKRRTIMQLLARDILSMSKR